jgi:hypothetical protein
MDAAAWTFTIALILRDDMEVAVHHGLTGSGNRNPPPKGRGGWRQVMPVLSIPWFPRFSLKKTDKNTLSPAHFQSSCFITVHVPGEYTMWGEEKAWSSMHGW